MKHPRWIVGALLAASVAAAATGERVQEKGGTDDFGPYVPEANWLKPVRPGYLERGCSVFVESPNRIWYTTDLEFPVPATGRPGAVSLGRGVLPPGATHTPRVMVLDASGNVVEEWTQWEHLLSMPHRVAISPYDPERNVWIIDRDYDQVFKFSHDGKKLLMTLGEQGVPGSDEKHFGRPTDIAFLPDGSFYISDGYTNTRVVKFDKDGKFLFQWGTAGNGPGQFKVQVHDAAVDPKGRVFVADRGNNRVQIFDAKGKYLDEWDNIKTPSYVHITLQGNVWVTSQQGHRIAEYNANGKLLTYWGMHGAGVGQFDDPHDLGVDAAGNLYVSIYSTQKVGLEKYVPKPNADRSRLVTPAFARTLPTRP